MTQEQAARTSFREYELRLHGFEEGARERWHTARWLAWQNVLLSPNIPTGRKPTTAAAFWTFPWEKPTDEDLADKAKKYKISQPEIDELNRIFAELDKKKAK